MVPPVASGLAVRLRPPTPCAGTGTAWAWRTSNEARQFRRDAKFYLGKPKSEVPELIRIARIDDKQFALTEDYQIGRITVELDDRGKGGPVVTTSTVELPDGPETFTLDE